MNQTISKFNDCFWIRFEKLFIWKLDSSKICFIVVCIVEEMIFEEASAPSGEVTETDGFGQAELETLAPLESVEEVDADLDQLPLARM